MCENQSERKIRCSYIYKKNVYKDDTCPICGSYAAVNIYTEQKLGSSLNEIGLHRLFFDRVQKVYAEMDLSVWSSLGGMAWNSATPKEQVFLAFCMTFMKVSGEATDSESDYWDVALAAEAEVRAYMVENKIHIVKQDEFQLRLIADGMMASKEVRTLQAHYGISVCGKAFKDTTKAESERKYQKSLKIAERLAVMGCSSQDNLPYFNAANHLASL